MKYKRTFSIISMLSQELTVFLIKSSYHGFYSRRMVEIFFKCYISYLQLVECMNANIDILYLQK